MAQEYFTDVPSCQGYGIPTGYSIPKLAPTEHGLFSTSYAFPQITPLDGSRRDAFLKRWPVSGCMVHQTEAILSQRSDITK